VSTIRRQERTYRGSTYHVYYDGRKQIPGVTTILNGGLPKPALVGWAARSCAEYVVNDWDDLEGMTPTQRLDAVKTAPDRARNTAAARGTDIHTYGEALAHGGEVTVPDELLGPVQAYARFLDTWDVQPLHVESTVVNRKRGYAGTLDLIADIGGVHWLFDIKTGKDVYDDVALQLAAYRYAQTITGPDDTETDMPSIEQVGVIHVAPDTARLVPVRADPAAFRQFLYILETYKWVAANRDDSPIRPALDDPPGPRLEVVR
jgi:hypothetical protein